MNKAIDAIGRIENLANRSAYEYTPEQVEAMFSVLESKVAEVKAKFTVTKNKENAPFPLGIRQGRKIEKEDKRYEYRQFTVQGIRF